MKINFFAFLASGLFFVQSSFAVSNFQPDFYQMKAVLADPEMLKAADIEASYVDKDVNVAYAVISYSQERELSRVAHENGRCGGFEALPIVQSPTRSKLELLFEGFYAQKKKDESFNLEQRFIVKRQSNPFVESALQKVDERNLRDSVAWLSSFSNRYHKATNPNQHVELLKAKIEDMLKINGRIGSVDLISHRSTRQKSLRVKLEGKIRPDEIIVLGAHLDSINQSFWGQSTRAPGADDNASGSANVLEALRVLLEHDPAERTLEFFWYAGEEGGLLGSQEIAQEYKSLNRDVVAVLQLDMTLYAGSGQFVLGSMTDFTSAWLRSYFESLNSTYIKAKIVEDKCGYGCSDHASWYRAGYPTLMPFEATFRDMNNNIHTETDIIDTASNFAHSAMFTKIAVAMALDLGNSQLRSP